jgi:curved DNA-binding protein CbpA
MSKRALKKYLNELPAEALQEQIFELYDRLKEVKEFYNFVFNPNEDKRLDEAKFKINKEYFPPSNRRPKKRRSIAQNSIKNFQKLGVDPQVITELMVFNLETICRSATMREIYQESFYKSTLKSFKETINYSRENSTFNTISNRLKNLIDRINTEDWMNRFAFFELMEDGW